VAAPADEPLTLNYYNRDAATLALVRGCTLVAVTYSSRGPVLTFDNAGGKAGDVLGEWRDGTPMVNMREVATASKMIRHVLRNGTNRPLTLSAWEAEDNQHEQGRND
jgi:hypothetical protein